MSNIIKIKRGAGKPANGVLKAGELGFDTTNKDLYIGTDDTDSSVAEKIGLGSNSTDFAKLSGGYGRGTTASSSGASIIDSPADGVVYKASSDAIGIMKILLPQDFNGSMIKFDVDILSHNKQLIETISFGGQIYKNANTGAYNWSYRSYDIKGSSVNHAMLNLPINFGRHNGRAAVSIGKIDTEWGYNVVAIKNIIVYYKGYSTDYWSRGWQIIIDANPLSEILNTHENPLSRNRENLGFTYSTDIPTAVPETGEGSVCFVIDNGAPLPIEEDGTGAITGHEALVNLGAIDYVVEQGKSGIWTYRKWNSGIAECWGKQDDLQITDGYAMFNSFPSGLFIDNNAECVNASAWYGISNNRMARKLHITATTQNYVYLRNYDGSLPTGTFAVMIDAKGRWK